MTDDKNIRALVRVIAYATAQYTGGCLEEILEMAYAKDDDGKPKVDQSEDEGLSEQVAQVYGIYPARCPNRGTSTGKCSKDKERIARLIRKMGCEKVLSITQAYIKDCIANKSYLKNFSTFLNNFPDEEATPATAREDNHYR